MSSGWQERSRAMSRHCKTWKKVDRGNYPPKNAKVLVCKNDASIYIASWDGYRWTSPGSFATEIKEITHWMQLPKPPYREKTKISLYQEALNRWGLPFQLLMLMEECAELIHAASKLVRSKTFSAYKIERLVDEIADVEIMTEQIKFAYAIHDMCASQKDMKLHKLSKMLKDLSDADQTREQKTLS